MAKWAKWPRTYIGRGGKKFSAAAKVEKIFLTIRVI
jgi:hypothetical protein